MRVLNLYAGLGGNRKLWPGHCQVTAVEIDPLIAAEYQRQFPQDTVIVADAHEYLIEHFEEFDFIWSSPPCQTHSRMNKATRHDTRRYPDMKLYQEIIFLREFFKGKWVVENVKPYYDLLIPGCEMSRHVFWTNFKLLKKEIASPPDFSRAGKEAMMQWLGITCEKNIYLDGNHDPAQVLRNCVHPELGLHIFNEAFKIRQEVLV